MIYLIPNFAAYYCKGLLSYNFINKKFLGVIAQIKVLLREGNRSGKVIITC